MCEWCVHKLREREWIHEVPYISPENMVTLRLLQVDKVSKRGILGCHLVLAKIGHCRFSVRIAYGSIITVMERK